MNLTRPAVWAVLEQHLEDAAFCWLRRQDGLWSPLFSRDELGLVDRVLDAHLEGLRVAGAAAIAPALENLDRWQTPDEAFVSTYVLAHTPAPTALAQLEAAIGEDGDLATGAAAALLWTGSDAALPLLQRWWNSSEPALRHAALPAAMRHPRVKRSTVVLDSEEDADPWLRARAYRAIGEWRLEEFRPRARRGLDDIAARCRFEAAAALSLLGDARAAERIEEELPALQGRTRRRAVLAWAGGVSNEAFALGFNRLAQDPALHRDLIWALAFRGDAAGLSQLAWWLQFPEHARLAAYAIGHVTGMDLEEAGLWQEDAAQAGDGGGDSDDDEESPAHDDSDNSDDVDEDDGLLDPDTAALAAWVDAQGLRFLPGHCYLGGQPLQTAVMRGEHATLPQLWQQAYRDCRSGDAAPLTQMCSPVLE